MPDTEPDPSSAGSPGSLAPNVVPALGEPHRHTIWLAEFNLLVNTGKEYFSIFLKAFGLYLAAVGATLKFFFDAFPASEERLALFAFGASLHVAAITGTIRWRQVVSTDGRSL